MIGYTDRERKIFRFFDGKRVRAVDPIELYKRVSAKAGDIEAVQKIATSKLLKREVTNKAHDDLVRYVREIFELEAPKGLDCEGCLVEAECVELLDYFYMFVGAMKKKFEPVSDLTDGNIAAYAALVRRRPRYREFFGFWLCRQRVAFRRAYAVETGILAALGLADLGYGYARAVSDSEEEANVVKKMKDASRGSR